MDNNTTMMSRSLVKADVLTLQGQEYEVHYFELRTFHGARRFSAEIVLDAGDRIILDDDSVTRLEARAMTMVPAMVYSRMLAGTA